MDIRYAPNMQGNFFECFAKLRIVALYVGSSLTIGYFVNDIQGYMTHVGWLLERCNPQKGA
jgi:hypothetical protein